MAWANHADPLGRRSCRRGARRVFRGVSIVGKTPYAILGRHGSSRRPAHLQIASARENLMLPTSAPARAHTLDPGREHWTLDAVSRNSPSSPNGSTMRRPPPVASSRCWRSGAP
jgi:hypothetical protein